MEYARYVPELYPELAGVIEDWDKLEAKEQKRTDIETLLRAREVDVFHFVALVGEAAMKYRDTACVIVAAVNLPQVVKKSVDFAMKKDGVKDREMLFKHASFLPVPAGAQFVNTVAVKTDSHTEVSSSPSLPSFEKRIDID
jgi:hypothetical protein